MDIAVIVLPGSNCDADAYYAIRDVLGTPVHYVWHEERALEGFDAVIVPGGFSYGDYLRAGAIATTSPSVRALRPYVARGGLVLGICNGFQVLLEAGLLPGAMLLNACGEFRCEFVRVRTERADTPFTCALRAGQILRLPIAHSVGRYYADAATRKDVIRRGQAVFRYCDARGHVTARANPNGSCDGIAGVAGSDGAVLGMMPHPERASEDLLGSADGRLIFDSLARWIAGRAAGRPADLQPAETR